MPFDHIAPILDAAVARNSRVHEAAEEAQYVDGQRVAA